MVVNFKVYKKASPNGRVTLFMGKRDFIDSVASVEPVDGVIVLDDEYVKYNRKVYAQLICHFRYGREDDEVMGLSFQKEFILGSEQIHPLQKHDKNITKLQERLIEKLGQNAFPFVLELPVNSPASVILNQRINDKTQPCGVQYFVKIFAGDSETDRTHRRSTVSLGIRKVQYAPNKPNIKPCTVVRKDFLLSPGELELEVTLDKQLYHHGEKIAVNVCVRNNSTKVVKKIKARILQGVDVLLFQSGQLRHTIASMESNEGCPITPGTTYQKTIYLLPSFISNRNRANIAIDGVIKQQEPTLASSTLLSCDDRDAMGIVVSYTVKIKLFLGAIGGELSAELPFILMHSRPGTRTKMMPQESFGEIEDVPVIDYN